MTSAPIKATLRKTLIVTDFTGNRYMMPKGSQVEVKKIEKNAIYSDGKGILGVQKEESYLVVTPHGIDADIRRDEFKTID